MQTNNTTQSSGQNDVLPPSATGSAPLTTPGLDGFDVFHRIGSITRNLHDALQQLGYDKQIEEAVSSLPDARTRLDYIARLTGDAADRVLNAVDALQQEQEQLDQAADKVRKMVAICPAGSAGTLLASETLAFLEQLDAASVRQRRRMTEIMLAQDFHDLTGQVIQKIVTLATGLEEQLVKLLLETTPPQQRCKVEGGWLDGPVVSPVGRTDVVTNQAQVDDLLESLGF